ncbi:hypothetical protein DHEL01_v206292 [Diaporthe helianthi]|uniref:Uncharacterized protein n=1 Tax=Diaporthe helianthi TaxID=158607 RepID=A0A2P5HYI9_DIAHE|nr:hypothetical protein DHEL01_v206292 [Diaporthe helianthi]
MRFSYIVSSFLLTGLSVAHLRRTLTGFSTNTGTLDPTQASDLDPIATTTQAPIVAALYERDGIDWDKIISLGFDVPVDIISHIFADDETKIVTVTAPGTTLATLTLTGAPETEATDPITLTVTLTAPGSLTTLTLTHDPETNTNPGTVTATVTAPGSSTTITLTEEPPETSTGPVTVTTTASQETVTTTLTTVPAPTEPPSNPTPGTGCYFPLPDGRLTLLPCGPKSIPHNH